MPTLISSAPPAAAITTVHLGIDPGVSGGLAAIWDDQVELLAMPEDAAGLWHWLRAWTSSEWNVIACMELVTGWVGGHNREGGEEQAEKTNPGAHMFRFGTNNGMLLMGLHAAGISVDVVSPRVWQKAVGVDVREKGISSTAWKNVLKQRAIELYPDLKKKITKATSDALLLAHYCRGKYG